MAGYVYLLGTHTFQWYKIGKSTVPEIRVRDLGILLPFKIEVFAVWKAEDHDTLEKLLHEKLAKYRINGEWFHFSPRRVKQLIEDLPKEALVSACAGFSNIEQECPVGKRITVRLTDDCRTKNDVQS